MPSSPEKCKAYRERPENKERERIRLCVPCNLSKADKLPHEFEAYRAAL